MRAAFIVQRRNYYKYMGPLIRAAAARGWDCEIWLLIQEDAKDYLLPTAENLPEALRGLARVLQTDGHAGLQELASQGPDAIFSLHTAAHHDLSLLPQTRFVTLQHGLDTFLESTPEQLASSDAVCLYGLFWLDWACRYYEAEGFGSATEIRCQLEARTLPAGSPQMDAIGDLDVAAIRRELGIPADKPVLVLLPVNISFWPGEWPWFFATEGRLAQIRQLLRAMRKEGLGFLRRYWRWALNGWNEAALMRSLRQFCDRHEAFLVVKTRRKDPLRLVAEQVADLALVDESYYRSTILKLLVVADVCIHFYSSAVLEAAAANTFGICVHRPNLETNAHRLWRTYELGDAFNFPGVNRWFTIPEFIEGFAHLELAQFKMEPQARRAFIQRYLTSERGIAAAVLDHIEQRSSRQPAAKAPQDRQ